MAGFLERFYPYFPLWLQNVGISLYGVYWKRQRFGPEFDRVTADFRERDHWPADRMRDYVNKTLKTVLQKAAEAPYYREQWRKAGLRESDLAQITIDTLSRLPILPKQAVRRSSMDFVPDRARRAGGLHSYATSGSTGTPVKAVMTREVHQRFAAAREARSFGWAGVSITSPRAMIGGRMIVPKGIASRPFYRYNAPERQTYFSAYHISPANVADYVQGFQRHRPEVVTGYAFSQFVLARMMLEKGLSFGYSPLAAITSSEKLRGPMKSVIQQAWGCRAYEEYGSVENCGLATECEHGKLHVSLDLGVIELVDADGNPVPPGVEGRVLCTGLLNDVQFLIRYEIGDVGVWDSQPCACGRDHLPVLKEIVGRLEDVVVGPDGREMVRFHGIFVDLPFVIEGQVIQEKLDRFRVRVVVEPGFGGSQVDEVRRRFRQRLGNVFVDIETVDELERTPNGKLRAVISKVTRAGM